MNTPGAKQRRFVELALQRETKGTWVYGTEELGAAVTQLYVKKTVLPQAPKTIVLTIEWEAV